MAGIVALGMGLVGSRNSWRGYVLRGWVTSLVAGEDMLELMLVVLLEKAENHVWLLVIGVGLSDPAVGARLQRLHKRE